jgi:transposase
VDFVKKKKGSKSAAVRNFGIGRQTVYDWLELDKQGKLLEVHVYPTKKSKLDYEEVRSYVDANPDFYYREIGEFFKTSGENIRRILKKLNYTVKKNKLSTGKQMKNKDQSSSKKFLA